MIPHISSMSMVWKSRSPSKIPIKIDSKAKKKVTAPRGSFQRRSVNITGIMSSIVVIRKSTIARAMEISAGGSR